MNIDWQLFLSAVALAVIFEAIPYVIAPERMRGILANMAQSDPSVLRRCGLFSLACGVAFLVFVRA